MVARSRFSAEPNRGTDELVGIVTAAVKEWIATVREDVDMITAAGEEWAGEVTVNVMPALCAEFIATAAADAPNTGFVSTDVAI
ncbi:hypothetical protein, partial [Pseudomonas aeruginosa]